MTRQHTNRFFAGLVAALLLGSGCRTPLHPSAKRHLLRAVGQTLSRRAYVYGTDFSRVHWREMQMTEQTRLDNAETDEEFAVAVQSVLDGYGVSHLDCVSPARAAERRRGKRSGIGVLGVELSDGILAAGVVVGSPAEQAGIQRGDLILRIDGRAARMRKQFRGILGQRRRLEWLRDGSLYTADLIQSEFRRASPDEMVWLDDHIAWIKIHSFSKRLYSRRQVDQFFATAADARGIILDLRGNLGGYVNHVEHLAGQVLNRGTRLSIIVDRNTVDDYHRKHGAAALTLADLAVYADDVLTATAPRGHSPYQGKLVVLVDSLSGSGGELLPAALQEWGRAEIIGAVSFGRVLLANYFSLPRRFRLHLPIGEVLTPSGKRLEGVGVQPDIVLTHREAANDDYIIALAREAILR